MPKGSTQDVFDLVERIRSHGFACELNGGGHWQVTGTPEAGEDGFMYGTFSATPTSARSLLNAITDLRKTTGVDFRVQRRTPRKEDRPVPTAPDPRKIALLADRNRNAAALAAAEERAAALNAASAAELAKLKDALDTTDHHVPTKAELDDAAMARAVERALAEPPAHKGNKVYPILQPPRLVTFTPDEMQALLDGTVCNTRPVQPSVVEKYQAMMEGGLWHVTHQGVAIDWHGCLVDGRQRFTAAIRAGMSLTIYATYGVDPATFFAMDTGKGRTAADSISIAGVKWYITGENGRRKELKPNRVSLAAAVAMCLSLDYRDPTTQEPYTRYQVEHTQYSREEIVRALAIMHDDGVGYDPGPYYDLGEYTGLAGELKRHAHLTMTAGYMGLFMCRRAFPTATHGLWHNQLLTGANLSLKSPALKLRNALMNAATKAERPGSRGGLTTLAQYALYIKAWNAFLEGKEITQLRWREDEEIPEPINPTSRRRSRG